MHRNTCVAPFNKEVISFIGVDWLRETLIARKIMANGWFPTWTIRGPQMLYWKLWLARSQEFVRTVGNRFRGCIETSG
jgi:hypothetical protein